MNETSLRVSRTLAGTPSRPRLRLPASSLGWLLPLSFFAAIELAAAFGWTPRYLLPPPSQILSTLADEAGRGLAGHIGASVLRVLAGFTIGAGLGVLVGVGVGLSRWLERLLDPSFQALRAVPSLAWVPLLLLWMGIDEAPKITLIAIGAFFPVYLGVVTGLRQVDRTLVELGESYGLSKLRLVRRILLPAALPSIFTGLRTSLSLAWMFLVAAELIAATRGLGYLLSDGRETSRPDIVIGAIVLLALLGKLSDGALKAIETRTLHWRDNLQNSHAHLRAAHDA
ncbi:sulfonate transport system permease protein [Xanthomonas arboricola]|uniref:Sulfonate transport system permease protein n=1 Tax=Xanthomonas cannabis TaxID=1885674 RepID=A0ABR6JK13_9XANT|nr:ABC transporter permease [Xanthomonas cannabis]MBB3803041.1 sulfonate transport system permease protein [Xanthomonas cannabis]MBB4592562.1 sulfonate transport system permease protein [Xanthomonas cannabis]MBB5520446.1 sulfonate transport system permease protein [Xanthomonas cannabis]NIK19710.1 sulfonate transport system permease protein [Xanthomonas cannabis]